MGHGAKAAGYLTSIPNLLSLRSCSVSIESLKYPTSAELVEAQKVFGETDVSQGHSQGLRRSTGYWPIHETRVWPRAPTDPSRWTWKTLHSWKWKHNGHITDLEVLSALTAVRWRARSSSLLRTQFVLFLDNQSSLRCLSNPVPVLASSMLSRGRQQQSCSVR